MFSWWPVQSQLSKEQLPVVKSEAEESSSSTMQTNEKDDIITAESFSMQPSLSDSEPFSLEGILQVRKGRSTGQSSFLWKRRLVRFYFENGGSITISKSTSDSSANRQPTLILSSAYSRVESELSEMNISSDMPWVAKDIENDPSTFVIEVEFPVNKVKGANATVSQESVCIEDYEEDDSYEEELELITDVDKDDDESRHSKSTFPLHNDEINAKHSGRPFRIYFRCIMEKNEKTLWLKAFSSVGRLSNETRKKWSLLSSLSQPLNLGSSRSRLRSADNVQIAKDARKIGSDHLVDPVSVDLTDDVERLARGRRNSVKGREYRVLPSCAYPHTWLTKAEMKEEMVLKSEYFHDLRVPGCKDKEIGFLEVEVLQCLGLPKLDRGSDTDAVVYLVCGSYAFATDVIPNRSNPMWLRKARRACIFPIFHGYASLYVGVFDHEPRRTKDDFAGRVEVNLSRLRPQSTYDVTLPLRLSTHVYSRRRRGAVRLRFTLTWHSERDALLSYIPKKLPPLNPQFSKPNYETTVRCTDQKAFRNIALTVHGAHLPGRFTFNQMRAAIREINFTRKNVFTAIRQGVRDTRQWQNPAISAFVFLSWMHCIYANTFSLVPAYAMLFFVIQLMSNYWRFCADGPGQRGFIPPTWEELFMALVRGGDPYYQAIEPLELGARRAKRRKSNDLQTDNGDDFNFSQCKVLTHQPRGKMLSQALGLVPDGKKSPDEDHLEFPFANGKDYPKFTVKECLVTKRHGNGQSIADDNTVVSGLSDDHNRYLMLQIPRFPLEVDLQAMIRKDSSGTKDFDEEEVNFNARVAVISQGRKAASKMTKTATAISEKTGLDYVVRPLSSGVGHISSGVGHMSSVAGRSVGHMSTVGGQMIGAMPVTIRRGGQVGIVFGRHSEFTSMGTDGIQTVAESNAQLQQYRNSMPHVSDVSYTDSQRCKGSKGHDSTGNGKVSPNMAEACREANTNKGSSSPSQQTAEEIDPSLVFPEQDIDIQGPNTGKKLTDDLAEIKDKMHELTWHLFDDHTYIIRNTNAVFFGESRKPDMRRKKNPAKQMDKYLHMGQYSHSNPFVSRVGMYVEPIIGSSYSILCLFRAGFNVATWRDPMLTFWVSLISGILSIILFFFPWRLFLFLVGVLLVGPQNWAIRVLREKGHLPPARQRKNEASCTSSQEESFDEVPVDKPIFTEQYRKSGNDPINILDGSIDPREIHEVVVPYGPLVHQRCNDWPPEPQYAVVRRRAVDDRHDKSLQEYELQRNISIANNDKPRFGRIDRLRRRLRRLETEEIVADEHIKKGKQP